MKQRYGSLATFGYANKDTEHEITCALIANKQALLIDIRLHPVCQWSPLWNKSALHARFDKRYIWRGNWLGNVNHHKEGESIELADEEQGIDWLSRGITSGYTLILLCGCFTYDQCHRKVIYQKVKQALGERLAEYRLGQRVLTAYGEGCIDPDVPLDVHRARNRYAVLLDHPSRLRFFFPDELEPYDLAQRELLTEGGNTHV